MGFPKALLLCAPLLCALVLGVALPAAAQDDGVDEEARSLFEAGTTAFAEGRYENALNYFRQAHSLSGRPEMLFNVGSAADRMRRDEQALEAFEAFLRALPDAENRAAVEARIVFLREQLAEDAAAEANARPAAPAEDGGGPGAAPWILVVGGGVALVTGGVLVALALDDKATVEGVDMPADWADYESRADRVPLLSTVGTIAAGVGAALLTVGLVWGLGGDADGERETEVVLGPSSLTVRGTL